MNPIKEEDKNISPCFAGILNFFRNCCSNDNEEKEENSKRQLRKIFINKNIATDIEENESFEGIANPFNIDNL